MLYVAFVACGTYPCWGLREGGQLTMLRLGMYVTHNASACPPVVCQGIVQRYWEAAACVPDFGVGWQSDRAVTKKRRSVGLVRGKANPELVLVCCESVRAAGYVLCHRTYTHSFSIFYITIYIYRCELGFVNRTVGGPLWSD